MAEFHQGNGQLHDSASQWRHIPTTAPAMLWLTDPTGNCTFRSQNWQAYTGQSAATALGEGWLEAVHPDDRAAVRETCRASHAQPVVFHRDFRLRRTDGVYRWTMDTGHPRRAARGAFLGYIGVLIDIDDRKQAMETQTDDNAEYRTVWPDGSPHWIRTRGHPLYETPNQPACPVGMTLDIPPQKLAEAVQQQAHEALEQRVAELTAALRHEMAERQRLERKAQRAQHFAFLGRLAADVSHEIRNPLGTISLCVDFLEEELHQLTSDSPAAMAESLTEIKTQIGRLTELMEDCLSMVRTSSIELTSQSLAALVTSWSAEIEKQAMARGVTIHLEGLAALEPVAVHANTLHRAVLNLLQNAVDAMSQGGTVRLVGQTTATQIQLLVQDTGSGIAAARLGRIFEPLYTTKPGGTGLGLYIVQEIVAAHGGQITVASEEGQGTTFTISLPRTAGKASAAIPMVHGPDWTRRLGDGRALV